MKVDLSDSKTKVIVGLIVVVVLLLGGYAYLVKGKKEVKQNTTPESVQNESVIPTVDSSVQVSLDALPGKKEVLLSVKNIPTGTKTLEYELSYEARNQGPQG